MVSFCSICLVSNMVEIRVHLNSEFRLTEWYTLTSSEPLRWFGADFKVFIGADVLSISGWNRGLAVAIPSCG